MTKSPAGPTNTVDLQRPVILQVVTAERNVNMELIYALLIGPAVVIATIPVMAVMIYSGASYGAPAKVSSIGGLGSAGVLGYFVADEIWWGAIIAVVSFLVFAFVVVGIYAVIMQRRGEY